MFNIPRTTLQKHVKSKVKTKHLMMNQILAVEKEKEVCSRILRYSEIGMPVTASIVKTYVFEFREKNNAPNSFNKSKLVLLGDTGFKDF